MLKRSSTSINSVNSDFLNLIDDDVRARAPKNAPHFPCRLRETHQF